MSALLPYLVRILAGIAELLGIVKSVREITTDLPRETQPLAIQTTVTNTQLAVMNLTTGLAAAHTERGAILTAIQNVRSDEAEPHLPTVEDVLTAIAGIGAITLPETPPTGYGGASAVDVWHQLIQSETYQDGYQNTYAMDHVTNIVNILNTIGLYEGVAYGGNPYFRLYYPNGFGLAAAFTGKTETGYHAPPNVDWATWDGVMSIVEFLNTVDEWDLWSQSWGAFDTPGLAQRPLGASPFSNTIVRCTVADWMLPYVSGRAWTQTKTPPRYTPPVWPGADFVTMGEPVDLASGFTVPGPMHGVIVDIASVPSRHGRYEFDGVISHTHIGSLVFASDIGDWEIAQSISLDAHVLCPKMMASSGQAKGRAASGVVGTVTPWAYTIT